MPWKPLHQAHAIERFRILIQFNSPLPDKVLGRVFSPMVEAYEALGFGFMEPVGSLVGQVEVPMGHQFLQMGNTTPVLNGRAFKRIEGDVIVEEAAFRDMRLGYYTMQYGRWANVQKRFWEVMQAPVSAALDNVNLDTIRIEYWDKFLFEGPPEEARPDELLTNVNEGMPEFIRSGQSVWHSHTGWFDDAPANQYLVNVNIDAKDEVDTEGKTVRTASFYNFAEFRFHGSDSDIDTVKAIVEKLHRLSATSFGSTLNPIATKAIGLDLREYKDA